MRSARAERPLPPSKALRVFYRLTAFMLWNRVTIRGATLADLSGPVLFVGLHRNGALDGIPYLPAAPDAVYLISAQLHRVALLRPMFPGIPIARRKDRERGIHAAGPDALSICVDHLRAGGRLFVLPEGTSTLGPRHLPFKPGAAQIASAVPGALTIVPLAIHYERAWAWQSRVEVVVGKPVRAEAASPELISELLETTGVNVESEERLRVLETLAFAGTLSAKASYAETLERWEREVPQELREAFESVEVTARWTGAWKFQELPLIPTSSLLREALELVALLPLVGSMVLLNAPPLLLTALAGRWLPDERHVVSFWRTLIGVPTFLLWGTVVAMSKGPLFALVYLLLTAVGIRVVRPLKMRAVAVHNALLSPRIVPPMRDLLRKLAGHLNHA